MSNKIDKTSAIDALVQSRKENIKEKSLLDIYLPPASKSYSSGPLSIAENFRTTLAENRAQGVLNRKVVEVQTAYIGKTYEIAERLKHDLRSQKMLNESQRLGGILETESLRAAAQIDAEQKMTTINAVQDFSQLETREKNKIASNVENGELTDEQAEELKALHEYLGNESKRDALDRHDRIRKRRQHQFEHASAIKTRSPGEWE